MNLIEKFDEEPEELSEKVVRFVRTRKTTVKLIIIGIVILGMLLSVWFTGLHIDYLKSQNVSLQQKIEELNDTIARLLEEPITVTPVVPEISLDVLNREIKEIGELATVEYLFTNAARFKESNQIKNWNIPFTEKSFMLKWDGVIKAGVKVDQIKVKVNQDEMKIQVFMPDAEILSYEIKKDSVELLDEKDNIFNPISVNDKVKFDAETEDEMKERAIENGILEKAQESAEKIIVNFLNAIPDVAEYYTIEFCSE